MSATNGQTFKTNINHESLKIIIIIIIIIIINNNFGSRPFATNWSRDWQLVTLILGL